MTATTDKKPTAAERFPFMGETLEVSPEVGYALAARYRQAAKALHAAKDEAMAIEEEIKALQQGYEHVVVNGERIFSWTWGRKTTFNKKLLREKYPQIEAECTTTVENGTRSFSAPGVSGVE